MGKYKVGDRVRVISSRGTNANIGDIGTIVYEYGTDYYDYGVEMDKSDPRYHNCCEKTRPNRGQWMSNENIEKISEYKQSKYDDFGFKLIITSKGDLTTAKLLHGKECIESTVRRYHKDKYSEKDAVKYVLRKLFVAEETNEHKYKYFTGKVVADNDGFYDIGKMSHTILKGHIYNINEGSLCVDGITLAENIVSVESLNEISGICKFIELKE